MKIIKSSFYWKSLIFPLFLFGWISQAQAYNQYPCKKTDFKKIKSVITKYVIKNSALSANEINLSTQQCVSSYASAIVHPIKPITDDAIIYLHKVKNQWVVMAMGTSFDNEFLTKIPKALRIR